MPVQHPPYGLRRERLTSLLLRASLERGAKRRVETFAREPFLAKVLIAGTRQGSCNKQASCHSHAPPSEVPPVVCAFIFASAMYHDRLWYPLRGRKVVGDWLANSPWGRLFADYQPGRGG